jgi:methionyl-tRNA synthetase
LHPCGSASSDSASSLRPTSPYSLIGYLSASIEWAQFAGDSKAWQRWWLEPDSRHAYFMGKDNIVFHSFLWPAMLAGYDGPLCELPDGTRVPLHRPDDIVASEFLTMEGRKFSSSRRVVIYVRDVLERYGPDPLRFSLAAGGPETADADFTWAEFVRRNNDELVATWGNLVQRVCAMLRRTGGVVPERTAHLPDGRELLSRVEAGFDTVGSAIAWHRFKQALSEALRLAHDVNAFVSLNEPWKVAKTDPELALGILSAAYDAVCDLNVMLTPFLPPRRPACLEQPRRRRHRAHARRLRSRRRRRQAPRPAHTPRDAALAATPHGAGTPLGPPSPLFVKIDTDVVENELARLANTTSA